MRLLAELVEIDGLFAFKELQTEVCGTEVSAHADEVGVLGSAPANHLVGGSIAHDGDADDHSCKGGGGVSSDDVDVVSVAGQAESGIEVVEGLDGDAAVHCHADEHLPWRAAHGIDIGDVHHGSLVAQVLHGGVDQVEVYAFEQEVGGEQCPSGALCGVDDGAIVADAFDGRTVMQFHILGEPVDKGEFAQFRYLHVYVMENGAWDSFVQRSLLGTAVPGGSEPGESEVVTESDAQSEFRTVVKIVER